MSGTVRVGQKEAPQPSGSRLSYESHLGVTHPERRPGSAMPSGSRRRADSIRSTPLPRTRFLYLVSKQLTERVLTYNPFLRSSYFWAVQIILLEDARPGVG